MINFLKISEKTKSMNLLYVEDDSLTRMSALELFEHIFNDVFVATDGQEGLELFLENKDSIDIIITDQSMPELNGTEMIREIRKIDKEILIYLFSGYSDDEITPLIKELFISENFVKPINYTQFIDSLIMKL